MTEPELDQLATLVRTVARSEIMPRFRNLAPGDVSTKSGPMDLVTIADEAAETALAHALRVLHPGCTVIGEEAATRNPALLEAIAAAPLCFIVDPIDGTFNFASGVPLFGVMLAVTTHGRTTAAIIHDPITDDTALARAGQGAWLRNAEGAATRLHVSTPKPLAEMAGTLSWKYFDEPRRTHLCARLPQLGWAWDYRCAAHQYRILAAGHCDFAVYNRTLPWDHAAGVLLHQEAGGHAARIDGTPYSPATIEGGLLCAPDQPSWTLLRNALFASD